jgi:hypothetical protein
MASRRSVSVDSPRKKNHDDSVSSSQLHHSNSSTEVSPVFSVNQGISYLNQSGRARHQTNHHKNASHHINDMSFAQLNFNTLGNSDYASKPGAVKFVDNEDVAAAADIELEKSFARLPLTDDDDNDIDVFGETTIEDVKARGTSNISTILTGKKTATNNDVMNSPTKSKNKMFFSTRSNSNDASVVTSDVASSPRKAVNRTFSLLRGGKVGTEGGGGGTETMPPTQGGKNPFRRKDKASSVEENAGTKEEKKKNRFFHLGSASSANIFEQSKVGMSFLSDDDDSILH